MLRRMLLPVLFWLGAAAAVRATSGSLAAIAVIFVAAYGYTRVCARHAGISHALGVGTAWLALAISAEIGMTTHALLGSPAHPLLRNLVLLAWVFAPACFAGRQAVATGSLRNHEGL